MAPALPMRTLTFAAAVLLAACNSDGSTDTSGVDTSTSDTGDTAVVVAPPTPGRGTTLGGGEVVSTGHRARVAIDPITSQSVSSDNHRARVGVGTLTQRP